MAWNICVIFGMVISLAIIVSHMIPGDDKPSTEGVKALSKFLGFYLSSAYLILAGRYLNWW